MPKQFCDQLRWMEVHLGPKASKTAIISISKDVLREVLEGSEAKREEAD